MKVNRGGKSLKVGDIGRFSILRQHILLPGERMTPKITGNVRLSGLRQQTSVYLTADIEAFASPIRHYQTDLPDYLQEGISTSKTIDTLTGVWTTEFNKTTALGIGKPTTDFMKFYAQHPINVWNEWYRWPEDSKISVTTPPISFYDNQGQPCVNLTSAPTRIHDAPSFDTIEKDVASATTLDVRTLEEIQARFSQAAKTDWTSQDRYNVFMQDVYGAKGSNEVDKVPIRLKGGASLSVQPRDMYATDGASLGELMSINNFQVNHQWDDFVAEEHMVVCYVMLLRFAPVFSEGVAPGIYPADIDYELFQGDPVVMASKRPTSVKAREVEDGDATVLGYLPFGWQHREGFSHVDQTVKELANFPLLEPGALTAAAHRDASNIENCFRSTALRHWFADIDFNINIQSRVPSAGQSIMTGSGGKGNMPGGNHPTGGNLQ